MNKKILYTLSTIAVTSAPIVTVVACGKKENVSIEKRDIKFDWTDVAIEEHTINNKFHINDNVWKKISDRFKNDLHIGPEFNSLRKIVFAGSPAIDSSTGGFYTPSARTLVLNVENFLTTAYIDETNDTFADEFVELVMQTMFHEYGHHIGSVYFNVIPLDHSEAYTVNSNSWLKGFVDIYKHALNYDITSTKLDDNILYTSNGYNIKSIGSVYDSKQIYDAFNPPSNTNEKNLPLSNGKDVYMFLGEKYIDLDKNDFNNTNIVDFFTGEEYEKIIRYQYSFEELFTRKFQQLKYIYNPSILNSEFINEDGWGIFNKIDSDGKKTGAIVQNSISEDRRNYESQGTDGTWSRFLEDRIFDNNNADLKLENGYSNVLGYKTNVDLSFIWNNNDVDISLDGEENLITGDESKNKEIKFGGFLETDEDYTHVSYQDSANNWVHLPIEVKDHFSGVKADVEATTYSNSSSQRKQYWTKEWVHKDEILDKILHFSKGITPDQTNSRPFATTRDDETVGYVTNNWIGSHWEIKGNDLIKATKDTEGVKISNWIYAATHTDVVNEYINNKKAINKVHLTNSIYQI